MFYSICVVDRISFLYAQLHERSTAHSLATVDAHKALSAKLDQRKPAAQIIRAPALSIGRLLEHPFSI